MHVSPNIKISDIENAQNVPSCCEAWPSNGTVIAVFHKSIMKYRTQKLLDNYSKVRNDIPKGC